MTIQQGDKGIDVSRYQTFTDYQAVANSGVKFGYVKATEGSAAGTNYFSPVADSEFNGLRSVGIEAGFYHFARYVSVADAIEEAKFFIDHIKGYDFTLPPALDLEYNGCGSVTVLSQATQAFLQYVEQQLGSAIVYLPASYYNMVAGSISNYGVWLADPSTVINIPKTIAQLYAWQNNWHGAVPGIASEVDLDVACGSFFTTRNKALTSAPTAPVKVAPIAAPPAPPVSAAPVAPAPSIPDVYTVRSGDSLSAIAARFGVSQSDLQSLNGITNPNIIYIGQVLRLHGGVPQPAPKAPSLPATYTIQPGDSLSAIAARFGIPQSQLQSLNGISNPNLIYAGQVLHLGNTAPAVQPVYHLVASGDTVSQLAAHYGSSQSQIVAWNGLASADRIYIGQRLRVK